MSSLPPPLAPTPPAPPKPDAEPWAKSLRKPSFLLPRLAVLCCMGLGLLGAWYLWAHDPKDGSNFFFRCVFHELTGLHCLGCGATRSGHALLNGRIAEAISQNAFFVGAVPLFAWLILTRLLPWMLGKTQFKPMRPWVAKWIVWFPVLLIIFAVLRNLPWPPWSWLAPF